VPALRVRGPEITGRLRWDVGAIPLGVTKASKTSLWKYDPITVKHIPYNPLLNVLYKREA
jgi:hypothetical protein